MQSADANLLVALDALLREGSVTQAARRMKVSPPAMSHTLSRLRTALGDPLLVRSGNRLVPTPRAVAMRERVMRAATEVDALLTPERPLDLSTLRRTFVIRASDAIIVTFGHALDVMVRREAGGVALYFVGAPADGLEVDLDVGVPHGRRSPDRRVQSLYEDDVVAVVRRGHPWAGKKVTPEKLAQLEYVAVATMPSKIEGMRSSRRPPLRIVPSFLSAAALVRESDAYTTLPLRLGGVVWSTFGLCQLAVRGPVEKMKVAQSWSPRFDNDAAHVWLRSCVRRTCGTRP